MLEIFIVMAVIIIILLIAFVIVYKRRKKVEDDINLDDFFEKIEEERMKKVEKEHEEDAKYNFPIKTSSARFIANKSETLKTDFCRNSNRKGISFLGFYEDAIELVEVNGKKYWQYRVLKGDISWIEHNDDGNTFCDGWLTDEDFKYLRCLIDVETGDYIYYPEVKEYKERVVKNKKDELSEERKREIEEFFKKFEET